MSKHTKGPWYTTTAEAPRPYGTVPAYCHLYDSAGEIIAIITHNPDWPARPLDNARADAQLIAASPELLEALKKAQQWIEFAKERCQLGTIAGGDWYIDQDSIRKAIAKAEGK